MSQPALPMAPTACTSAYQAKRARCEALAARVVELERLLDRWQLFGRALGVPAEHDIVTTTRATLDNTRSTR